jgi:DNA-binding NarL/FixJ family response regulator
MHSNHASARCLELLCRYPRKTRVLIADQYPIERLGLRAFLDTVEDILVVAETSSSAEVLSLVELQNPDVLILEAELSEPTAVTLVKQIKALQSPVQVLGFGGVSVPNLYDLLQSGVAGYLTKDEALEAIVAAVRNLAYGNDGWVSHRAAVQLIRTQASREEAHRQMTVRQRQVLGLVAAGHTNQQIAKALGISVKTAEKHLSHLMAKLGMASRVEMAVQAVQKGWVSFATLPAR